MKGKATISSGVPDALFEAFRTGSPFARKFIIEVVESIFGAELARFRPAEYFVQHPDELAQIEPDFWGVVFAVSGISRTDEREPKVFHGALERTHALCVEAIQGALEDGQYVQLFVNMMMTGDVPLPPPRRGYTPVLETEAVWVGKDSVSAEMPNELKTLVVSHLASASEASAEPPHDD